MKESVMSKIYAAVMREYNKVGLRSTQFMESWEYSVKKSRGHVVVQFSRAELEQQLITPSTLVQLEKCKGENMGLYLAEMISYDPERNHARMRLLSKDPAIDGVVAEGSPLCSKKYFKRFWRKHLSEYGDMETVLMG